MCTTRIPRARSFSSSPRLKSGASTPTKTRGRSVGDALQQLAAQAQQPRQVAQHFDVAAHGQLAHVVPRVESRLDHAVAADAAQAERGFASLQFGQHAGRQQVARRLAGDEGDAGGDVHQRMMPRGESRTKSRSSAMAAADAGASAISSSSAATASATVLPSR